MDKSSNTFPIEQDLIESLQPIRGFVKASMIYHFFESGLFDFLLNEEQCSAELISSTLNMDTTKLTGLLDYLVNENILSRYENNYSLTSYSLSLDKFRGWFIMLIGGYGKTFLQVGDCLDINSGWADRNSTKVGIGSCGISQYDAIPLTKYLIDKAPGNKLKFLDLGCGNAMYLAEFCKSMPNVAALGVEPDPGGAQAAINIIEKYNLTTRVRIVNSSAIEFFDSQIDFEPDFTVLGFVLHEILGQSGEAAVITFLRKITTRFPNIKIIAIEVEDKIRDPKIMRHGLGLAYYNPYYLLHYFTNQLLGNDEMWERIFSRAGLSVLAKASPSTEIDSTGLEIGYLLVKTEEKAGV